MAAHCIQHGKRSNCCFIPVVDMALSRGIYKVSAMDVGMALPAQFVRELVKIKQIFCIMMRVIIEFYSGTGG
jgi:hypothetical protein